MSQLIKTIIKFQKGTKGQNNGKIFGFVTKQDGHWRGCRDIDECKKKIVFVDPQAAKDVLTNIPYNATLIPMRSEQGFIATSVSRIQYSGKILTKVRPGEWHIIVKFGMKKILYDPSSDEPRYNNIAEIANTIRHRQDLKDAIQVAEDFIDSACILKSYYEKQCLLTQ